MFAWFMYGGAALVLLLAFAMATQVGKHDGDRRRSGTSGGRSDLPDLHTGVDDPPWQT